MIITTKLGLGAQRAGHLLSSTSDFGGAGNAKLSEACTLAMLVDTFRQV